MDYGRRYFRERGFGSGIANARPDDAIADHEDNDRQAHAPEATLIGHLKLIGEQILRAYQGAGAIELGIPTVDDTPLE